ncbi:hypothetical protein L1D46_15615 [Pseudoalteromonas sp. Isolate3]|uniref:hypothetical protein n=1 Tax=Pseudoalteromonas sp. Isolate3 TaxID=2908526 RepID=UPI001EFC6C41|nr:hypothetical protein [Pseudoalteromonas sp. Isolate3]MCG9710223.1 hypothetical protein [Pseudoalteromonas sp. Isolate3]
MAHCSSYQTALTNKEQSCLDDHCSEYELHAHPFLLCKSCNDPLYKPIKVNGELYCSNKCAHKKEVKKTR